MITSTASSDRNVRRIAAVSGRRVGTLQRAAVVRVGFGLVWAVDASFKWRPGFIHGQTLGDELGQGAAVRTPVVHQWIQMWHDVATAAPGAFAVGTALTETCIALGLIFGVFSNAVFIGSALYSLGIWSSAEAFGLPWTAPGITDLGPALAYVFASLALFHARAGAAWTVDAWLRPKLGRLTWLSSPAAKWAEAVAVGQNVRSIEPGDRVLYDPEDRAEVRGTIYVLLRERDIPRGCLRAGGPGTWPGLRIPVLPALCRMADPAPQLPQASHALTCPRESALQRPSMGC